MTIPYQELEPISPGIGAADMVHEGVGKITGIPGGFDLECLGSRQGAQGCMAFYRTPLPDHVSIRYGLVVHSQRGLVINYLSLFGIRGEDPFSPGAGLPARDGIMANYWAQEFGLRSYHISFTRYNDKGEHTGTANIRRNPGGLLVGHGVDPVREVGRKYDIQIIKDLGSIQMFVDGVLAISCVDHATNLGPVPGAGYFGFRLVGDDVRVTVTDLRVHGVKPAQVWNAWVFQPGNQGVK